MPIMSVLTLLTTSVHQLHFEFKICQNEGFWHRSVKLSPVISYSITLTKCECLWRSQLEWFGGWDVPGCLWASVAKNSSSVLLAYVVKSNITSAWFTQAREECRTSVVTRDQFNMSDCMRLRSMCLKRVIPKSNHAILCIFFVFVLYLLCKWRVGTS